MNCQKQDRKCIIHIEDWMVSMVIILHKIAISWQWHKRLLGSHFFPTTMILHKPFDSVSSKSWKTVCFFNRYGISLEQRRSELVEIKPVQTVTTLTHQSIYAFSDSSDIIITLIFAVPIIRSHCLLFIRLFMCSPYWSGYINNNKSCLHPIAFSPTHLSLYDYCNTELALKCWNDPNCNVYQNQKAIFHSHSFFFKGIPHTKGR